MRKRHEIPQYTITAKITRTVQTTVTIHGDLEYAWECALENDNWEELDPGDFETIKVEVEMIEDEDYPED